MNYYYFLIFLWLAYAKNYPDSLTSAYCSLTYSFQPTPPPFNSIIGYCNQSTVPPIYCNNTLCGLFVVIDNLTDLLLGSQKLSGIIPTEIGHLTSLVNLYLNNNTLSGKIPTQIGNLTLLTQLLLDNNKLSGTIPSEIGDLTSLAYLDLSHNRLSGAIPKKIGFLTSLQYLYLNNNALSGAIPIQIGTLTSLKSIYLNNNQFSGPIPNKIVDLINLTSLNLDQSGLSVIINSSTLFNNGVILNGNIIIYSGLLQISNGITVKGNLTISKSTTLVITGNASVIVDSIDMEPGSQFILTPRNSPIVTKIANIGGGTLALTSLPNMNIITIFTAQNFTGRGFDKITILESSPNSNGKYLCSLVSDKAYNIIISPIPCDQEDSVNEESPSRYYMLLLLVVIIIFVVTVKVERIRNIVFPWRKKGEDGKSTGGTNQEKDTSRLIVFQ